MQDAQTNLIPQIISAAPTTSPIPGRPSNHPSVRASGSPKVRYDWPIISWMVVAHALAAWGLFHFTWTAFSVFLVMHFVACCLGITFGYHRFLSHRTFKGARWLERFGATCGVMALQGSPLEWVAHHRMHHAHVDTPKDPHNSRSGFWYSHLGWIFQIVDEWDDKARQRKYGRDIVADKYLMFIGHPLVMIGLQVFFGVSLWLTLGLEVMLWGVFVRVVAGYHITWCVNSIAHMWGYRNYKSNDRSVNNWWVAVLAFGEGWHNNHHMYDSIAPAGHKWWEYDVTMWVIRFCAKMGWAWDVRGLNMIEPVKAFKAVDLTDQLPDVTVSFATGT